MEKESGKGNIPSEDPKSTKNCTEAGVVAGAVEQSVESKVDPEEQAKTNKKRKRGGKRKGAGRPKGKKNGEVAELVKGVNDSMKLAYTILYVEDVSQTVNFYRKAFGLQLKFLHESCQYAELETGTTSLAFASNTLAASNLHPLDFKENRPYDAPAGMEIAFSTNYVRSAYLRALNAGAQSIAEPKLLPWGQTIAYIRDNNGIIVEIASEAKIAQG